MVERIDLPAFASAFGRMIHDAGSREREVQVAAASPAERLAERNFAELSPAELQTLSRLMRELRLAPPPRLTRRSRRDPHGDRLDVRSTLRAARRTGGDPARR